MTRNGSNQRLPAWSYGAIAAVPALILIVFYAWLDTFSRIELLIPAVFWIAAFVIISLRRRSARS
jgi:hypothetical protein